MAKVSLPVVRTPPPGIAVMEIIEVDARSVQRRDRKPNTQIDNDNGIVVVVALGDLNDLLRSLQSRNEVENGITT